MLSLFLGYVGPGGALSAVGTFVALLLAVVFAIVGFVWYPLKRLWRALRKRSQPSVGAADAAAPEAERSAQR
jgi:hypothetical protein